MESGAPELGARWDNAYAGGAECLSWQQPEAHVSLRLIAGLGLGPADPILDVGGGASPLAGGLLEQGHTDVTVLDVSRRALELARGALGPRAGEVAWLCTDVLAFEPERRYAVWHDRAVLHFLVDRDAAARYAAVAARAVRAGGHAVIGAFAPDGPARCSGLPVRRYDVPALAALLGACFELEASEREQHVTPRGALQPFTWVVARRRDER